MEVFILSINKIIQKAFYLFRYLPNSTIFYILQIFYIIAEYRNSIFHNILYSAFLNPS